MVLLPKQWKSRSSPGFAGGVEQNPFAMFLMPLPGDRAAAFLFWRGWSSPPPFRYAERITKGAPGLLSRSPENLLARGGAAR